jgi:iron complex outermembrane receptor protein
MTGKVIHRAAGTFLSLMIIALTGINSAHAQTKDFNVPAQSATTGIPMFARQAGIQILVSEPLVRGKNIAAVSGSHSVREALTIILKGTGLIATSKDGTTYTVAPASAATTPSAPPAAGSSENPSVPDSKSDPLQKDGLSEVIVTGTHISGVQNRTIPLLTFDKEAIDRSGYASLSDFITSLPQNVKSGIPPRRIFAASAQAQH